MADELKACPVCHKDGATDRYIRDGRQMFCPHCGWSAPCTFHGPDFEQRLADSWNTRTETQSQATIDELVALRAFRDRVLAAVEFVEPLAPTDRLALESAVIADRENGMSLRKCAEKHGTTLSVVRTILSRHGCE